MFCHLHLQLNLDTRRFRRLCDPYSRWSLSSISTPRANSVALVPSSHSCCRIGTLLLTRSSVLRILRLNAEKHSLFVPACFLRAFGCVYWYIVYSLLIQKGHYMCTWSGTCSLMLSCPVHYNLIQMPMPCHDCLIDSRMNLTSSLLAPTLPYSSFQKYTPAHHQ
jgi:hypothetical protein